MQIRQLSPVLVVDAIEPCLPFWTERLGFELVAQVDHGGACGFALLANGGVRVMLQSRASISDDMPKLSDRDRETSVLLYIDVDDIDAIERNLDGLTILVPRRKTFYGAEEVGVREPGGNVVVFARHDRAES